MGLLESFLDAPGLSGTLGAVSRTVLDDWGGLKHYACIGSEASLQAYDTQETSPAAARAEPSPQNVQIQQDCYSYELTRIVRIVVSGASTRFEAQGLGGLGTT